MSRASLVSLDEIRNSHAFDRTSDIMLVVSKPLKQSPRRSLTIAFVVFLIFRTRLVTLPKDSAVSLSGIPKGKGKAKRNSAYEGRFNGSFAVGVPRRSEGWGWQDAGQNRHQCKIKRRYVIFQSANTRNERRTISETL